MTSRVVSSALRSADLNSCFYPDPGFLGTEPEPLTGQVDADVPAGVCVCPSPSCVQGVCVRLAPPPSMSPTPPPLSPARLLLLLLLLLLTDSAPTPRPVLTSAPPGTVRSNCSTCTGAVVQPAPGTSPTNGSRSSPVVSGPGVGGSQTNSTSVDDVHAHLNPDATQLAPPTHQAARNSSEASAHTGMPNQEAETDTDAPPTRSWSLVSTTTAGTTPSTSVTSGATRTLMTSLLMEVTTSPGPPPHGTVVAPPPPPPGPMVPPTGTMATPSGTMAPPPGPTSSPAPQSASTARPTAAVAVGTSATPPAAVTGFPGLGAAGAALTRRLMDTASLLAVLLFGLLFLLVTVAVFVTQAYDGYRRRDYTQVDYLINGMYSDSGV